MREACEAFACPQPEAYAVAYSGGADSTALLCSMHAWLCSSLPARPAALRALHADHGLHAESAAWASHCREVCERLDIEFHCEALALAPARGDSVEAVAREERYAYFARVLRPGEALVSAHHADDQALTLLLALMRGSGVEGLAAMPALRALGRGLHLRPLLSLRAAAVRDCAARSGLPWLEDPANADTDLSRNFLRERVLPLLEQHWPGAVGTLGRSASFCAEAAAAMHALGNLDRQGIGLDAVSSGPADRQPVAALAALPEARARNAVRAWIRGRGLVMPPSARLRQGLHDLLVARADAQPCLRWPAGEIRRYRGNLYLMRPLGEPPDAVLGFDPGAGAHELPGELGAVSLVSPGPLQSELRARDDLQLRFRRGGERIRLPGSECHSSLKSLLQSAGIVPWMRGRVPLLYAGDELVAVADLGVSAHFARTPGDPGVGLCWDARPALN